MIKIEKPWGYEMLLEASNDKYVVKLLKMNANNSCSLQYHEKKQESFYLLEGMMKFEIGESENTLEQYVLNPGAFKTILPGQIHRMSAITDIKYLEMSTPELDDVIRLKDFYGRV